MDDSPYRSPETDESGMRPASDMARDPVRRVARYQRWVIFALLVLIITNILGVIGFFSGWAVTHPMLASVVSLLSFGTTIFAIVAVFLLAKELLNVGLAILCAILMLIPVVSLIVLLVLSQKAIAYLKDHRVEVGFFGVDPGRV